MATAVYGCYIGVEGGGQERHFLFPFLFLLLRILFFLQKREERLTFLCAQNSAQNIMGNS